MLAGTERLDRAEARVEELLGRALRPADTREPRNDRAGRSRPDSD
jgi:hypothetical protein